VVGREVAVEVHEHAVDEQRGHHREARAQVLHLGVGPVLHGRADDPQLDRAPGVEGLVGHRLVERDDHLPPAGVALHQAVGRHPKKTTTIGRLELFKSYREQPDDEVTLDSVMDQLVIAGTPDSVAEHILEFQEETGEFGELVYAGMDWVDPELAQRSMELMASKVMPQVNAHTGQAADD
jgi:alkanesulfonate monooxygenase SsuD/methylene tetrahydromethanopterin reductase-like flavin-dependent oxidoreductase (luciferase family)